MKPNALFSLLGHKGDLMIVHFPRTLDELNHAQLRVATPDFTNFSSRRIVRLGR